jgi:cell division protein FtsQ
VRRGGPGGSGVVTGTATPLRPAGDAARPRPGRGRTLALVLAGTVAVAVFATWLVAFSSVFGVRTITVRGVHVLTAAQVRAAAGIARGTPLVRVDTAAVTQRVERLPEVASAQVSTSFPSTVLITVDERVAVGYLRGAHGAVLVDRTGDQYRTVAHPPAGLPQFVVPAGASARTTGGAVATVAAVLPTAVRKQVRSINALDPGAITLLLSHGRVVQWGSAARSADKARLLPALLDRGASQIDLSNPDQPFTR